MHDLLIVGPKQKNAPTFVFAHGAGAPMDHAFMNQIAEGLAKRKIRVVRFEFPYMAQRRQTGAKKAPNRAPILEQTWLEVIDNLGTDRLVIGGKSMGGRIASMVAGRAGVAGVVCLGYPFHPPGNADKLRIEHLKDIPVPVLIVQGERDTFGDRSEVTTYPLGRKVKVQWLTDGDHGFKPRKSSGVTLEENIETAIGLTAEFIERHLS